MTKTLFDIVTEPHNARERRNRLKPGAAERAINKLTPYELLKVISDALVELEAENGVRSNKGEGGD